MSNKLSELIEELQKITEKVSRTFGNLNAEELNRKPSPDSWSIAQCLEHLIITNEKEFPAVENALKEGYKNPFWSKLPFLPKLCGNALIYLVKPENVRRFKAPKSFLPSQSSIRESIVKDFVRHQEEVRQFFERSRKLDLQTTKIVSPVSDIFTYSLLDCYRILVLHEERHFRQAERVLKMESFSS